jgi:hypothetical protein
MNHIRDVVSMHGGHWLPTTTNDVTHLIVDFTAHDYDVHGFRPILVYSLWIKDSLEKKVLLPTPPYELLVLGPGERERGVKSAA